MSARARRVVVVGEALCDLFAPRAGDTLEDARVLVPRLGGAPANVAVQLARLGVPVALVSTVGRDPLGARVRRALAHEGVDCAQLEVDPARRTGLTLVEVAKDGARRFFGWRENAADLSIRKAQVDAAVPGAWAVVHGTVSLRAPGPRAATWWAGALARKHGALVCVDVNLRPGMYARREDMLERARTALRRADVLKASDEECVALFGPGTPDAHVDALLDAGARLVLYTRGAKGAVLATRHARVTSKAPRVSVVDTTGAGDAFLGAAIAALRERVTDSYGLATLDEHALRDVGAAANAAGARCTTRLGATTGMLKKRKHTRALR